MSTNLGRLTFRAGEDLEAHRRVKIDTSGTQSPIDVVYAGAGEAAIGVTTHAADDTELVTIQLLNYPGSFECEAAVAFTVGATAYGAASGKISTVSSGTAIGVVKAAVSGSGSIAEVIPSPYVSTTAATVSVADTATHTSQVTVEAALAELYASIDTAKKTIPIPLGALMLEDGTVLTKFADGDSATPGFNQVSNKEVVLRWNNHASPTKVAFSVPMPQEMDGAAVVEVHWLALMSGANDTPDLQHECYFDDGDTDCAGTDDEIDGGATLTEYSATIGASDVPDTMPSTLTCIFGPKATELGTDDLLVYAVWLEVEYAKLS